VSLTSVSSWPPAWLTPIDDEMVRLGEGEDVIDFADAFGIITKDSIAGKAGSPMDLRDWQDSYCAICLPMTTMACGTGSVM
jgi:hypothetical protein